MSNPILNKVMPDSEKSGIKQLLYFFSLPLTNKSEVAEWKSWERNVFRFLFIFFLYFIIPLDPKFYGLLFSSSWLQNPFYNLLELSKYQPEFIALNNSEGVPLLGLASFANWGIGLIIAFFGAIIWGGLDKNRKEYTVLYFWLRILLRYRVAIALIAFGVYKLFLIQIPSPSLSNLFTNYGDAYAWKVYYQTTGISSFYVSLLGAIEILAALLLLYRKTTTWGAGLIIGYLGNVAVANSFYDIGELSFSTFLVLSAVFLFAQDAPRLYQLLVKEKIAVANQLKSDFSISSWPKWRTAAKLLLAIIFVTVIWTGYSTSSKGFGSYKYPQTPGLENAYGVYDVKQFILNGDTLAYSNTNPNRWQNVIFEKWSTISINVDKPQVIDQSSADDFKVNDIDRNYELAGFAGRHYYHYEIDTAGQKLSLTNKNRHHRNEKLSLTYTRPNKDTIILKGTQGEKDTVEVVLERIKKNYMLLEGRRKASKL